MQNQKTKVTPQDVEDVIVDEKYITPEGSPMLTICLLTLKNGAKVSGTNFGAIDPRWHSAEKGKEEARRKAIDKVYELEGYLIRQRLMEESNAAKAAGNEGKELFFPIRGFNRDHNEKDIFVSEDEVEPWHHGEANYWLTGPIKSSKMVNLIGLCRIDPVIESTCVLGISIKAIFLSIGKLVIRVDCDIKPSDWKTRAGRPYISELDFSHIAKVCIFDKKDKEAEVEIIVVGNYNYQTGTLDISFAKPKVIKVTHLDCSEADIEEIESANSMFSSTSVIGYLPALVKLY